ncbi:MAG: helix-turn-helix domain-containing protein [Pirellulales bacterium]|nr:helix-turn-helix domain-containing protein [Pirellulales bacterium]
MDKFVSFDEAIEKLGISSDRLNKLREDGELRAYRDGTSWKFRRDEIERFATEGLPDDAPPSDISLVADDELMEADALPDLEELAADPDELKLADLSLGDDLDLAGSGMSLDDEGPDASELDLSAEDEDTVTTSGPSPSDSILLSEEELGESVTAPPSTIIGREELEGADLDLALDEDGSDVKLAPSSGTGESHVLSSGIAGSGVLDELEKESGHTSAFADLEELELDLAAESSRVLSADDLKDAKGAGRPATPPPAKQAADSDLQIEDLTLDDDEGTDPVPAEAEKKEPAKSVGDSDIDLASDDDFVLAEAGGSDITLDSGDSGINLVSPSDSGLALDDIPLDVGGSAILSSLSLDLGEDDFSLGGSGPATPVKGKVQAKQEEPLGELQAEDDFNLTPMADLEDDGDSSSQVIALDAEMEGFGEEAEGAAFGFEEVEPGAEMEGEYGEEGLGVSAYAGTAVAPRRESEYSVFQILALGGTGFLLLISTILLTDMVRNIWGWQENLSLTSSMLDGILGIFGMRSQ